MHGTGQAGQGPSNTLASNLLFPVQKMQGINIKPRFCENDDKKPVARVVNYSLVIKLSWFIL